ncbi:RNA polymerase III transcription factor IIIC subunit-domain-containing protein [Biscogniauxia mediterranea]|nr:RNA polymerase III transcription factor IIIC subunit-domain-containing protein [Biscogniauxia mediterranea]
MICLGGSRTTDDRAHGDNSSSSSTANINGQPTAPTFEVPERKIVAVEHPCILLNLDNGLKAFGPQPNFHKLIDDQPEPKLLPLWFRPDNPTSKPIASYHAATNNILFKITVPKRTGRKRKRGSDEPFSSHDDSPNTASRATLKLGQVSSVDRQDAPTSILRKLRDNVDRYHVKAVGVIRDSHRYRGLADFQFANSNTPFVTNVAEHLLPLKVSKLRQFKLKPGVDTTPTQEIIPPPHFTDKVIGFNYNYEQNPGIKESGLDEAGETRLVNTQGRKKLSYGYFIHHNQFPVPDKPQQGHDKNYKVPDDLLDQLNNIMAQRPIWTRRALLNHIHGTYTESVLKFAIQLVGYQFRGGPWRDAIVKYGVDPRSDPKYSVYQTLAFKLARNTVGMVKLPWQTIRKGQVQKHNKNQDRNSHMWDGESYSTDGKFWQICDITDPFVLRMIKQAPLQTECDLNEAGWYPIGMWRKIKVVMKAKMVAIKKGRLGSDDDSPQKKGYLYNSFLDARMQMYPDVPEKPFAISLEGLLRPLEDLNVNKQRRRTLLSLATNKTATSAAADAPSSPSGVNDINYRDDERTHWDSDTMLSANEEVDIDGDGSGWRRMVDSDDDDDDDDDDDADADDYYDQEYDMYGEGIGDTGDQEDPAIGASAMI